MNKKCNCETCKLFTGPAFRTSNLCEIFETFNPPKEDCHPWDINKKDLCDYCHRHRGTTYGGTGKLVLCETCATYPELGDSYTWKKLIKKESLQ